MQFKPNENRQAVKVPYFEDVRSSDGWEGQGSEKSIDTLKEEVARAVGRLGGFVHHYVEGTYTVGDVERPGLQLFYSLGGAPARIDIAGLPTRNPNNRSKNRNSSLKMALYMLRNALNGLWFLQQLSPGYAPLMPWMIADSKGNTISQLWAQGSGLKALLPPADSTFEETVEGEEV